MLQWDTYLYNLITSLTNSFVWWQALAVIAGSFLIWLLVLWYLVGVVLVKPRHGRWLELLAIILGGAMVYLFNIIVTLGWFRPRPFLILDTSPLIAVAAASKSFPSDHASLAFFIAYLLSYHQKSWRYWAYVTAALVAIGRVAVGVHYPLDVISGAVVGLIFGYLTISVKKLFIRQQNSN